MREIRLARLDKTRPVLLLTREPALPNMTKVTAAPITTAIKGLSSEVRLGRSNGLDGECAASLDNILTISQTSLGRRLGFLHEHQERSLARAFVVAFDLDAPFMFAEGV